MKAVTGLEPLLSGILHAGEAEVIQLARELGARKVLIDEAKGGRSPAISMVSVSSGPLVCLLKPSAGDC